MTIPEPYEAYEAFTRRQDTIAAERLAASLCDDCALLCDCDEAERGKPACEEFVSRWR